MPNSPRRHLRVAARIVAVTAAVGATAAGLTLTATAATATPAASSARTAHSCATTVAPGYATCFALRRTDVVQPNGVGIDALPSGYGPTQLASAYKLTSGGSGQTVAIVDAYDDPNAATDLATYRSTYGLPALTSGQFKKVNQSGSTTGLPKGDTGWAGEISLDLDMVSATCPQCNILLVEATSPSIANLGASVNTAVSLGAKYVSNSYGGAESSSNASYDSSYYTHAGVAVTASTGDNGYGASYPATGAGVTAVGGTSLSTSSNSRGWTESAWSGAGAGCSAYTAKPSFQTGVTTGCTKRAEADVSAVADPNTGVAVYQTYGGSGWAVYGGTSASSPIIASVYALAASPGSTPNADPYAHTGNLFDVTTGNDGSCTTTVQCTAGTGWDGPTGLGTPNGTAAFSSGTTGGGGGGGGGGTGTCSGQKLGNPGFESGNTTWTASSGVITNDTGASPHSGSYYAWLDGYGTTHTDTVSQAVTIPTGCKASLSYYLDIDSAEGTTTAYDTFTVKAGSTTLATYSNKDQGTTYVAHTVSLTAYAGTTVTITFAGKEDSSTATSFLLDDTAVTLS